MNRILEVKRFRISYDDQANECVEDVELDFYDTDGPEGFISAREWAEDYAYALADKGWYKIKEIRR